VVVVVVVVEGSSDKGCRFWVQKATDFGI